MPRVLTDGATCWTNSNPVAQQGFVIVQGRRVAHRERVVAWGAGKYRHGITDTKRESFSDDRAVCLSLYRRRRHCRAYRGHAPGAGQETAYYRRGKRPWRVKPSLSPLNEIDNPCDNYRGAHDRSVQRFRWYIVALGRKTPSS